MSTLSRRSLVAGAASLPALAAGTASALGQSDAELVELGRQFEQLRPKYLEALYISNEDGERTHALAWQRVGRTDFEQPPTREQMDAFFAVLRQAEADAGWNLSDNKYETLCEEISDLAEEIMEIPAHSIAGLRAKVMVAAHTNDRLWRGPFYELDWDKKGHVR